MPEHWAALAGELELLVEVVFSDGSGWEEHHHFSEGSARILLPKASAAAILLRPVYRGRRLAPAASAVPWLEEKGRVVATWHDGVLGTVLERLAAGGAGFASVNVARLSQELRIRAPNDPFSCDVEKIAGTLAEGAFRSTYIKERPGIPVEIDLPQGSWIGLDPVSGVVIATPGGRTTVPVPPQGGAYLEVSIGLLLRVVFDAEGRPTYSFWDIS